jgi:regulatory protein
MPWQCWLGASIHLSRFVRKLADIGGDAVLIEDIIAELQLRKLQSDTRFRECLCAVGPSVAMGPVPLKWGCGSAALTVSRLRLALEASGYDWCVQAVEVRQRRFGEGLPTVARERARQLRFLQYRGFAGREISAALKGEVVRRLILSCSGGFLRFPLRISPLSLYNLRSLIVTCPWALSGVLHEKRRHPRSLSPLL